MPDDFYDLLDIPADASRDAIREAFREQANVYHPDVNDDERATDQFATLKLAYDVLSDPAERRAYDRLGHEAYLEARTTGPPSVGLRGTPDGRPGASHGRLAAPIDGERETSALDPVGPKEADDTRVDGPDGEREDASPTAGGTATAAPIDPRSNPLLYWWRRRNLSLPLLWLSVGTYLIGLAHFSLANVSALYAIVRELVAAGTSISSQLSIVLGGRHGLQTPLAFVLDVEFGPLSVGSPTWYAVLGAGIALPLSLVLARRIGRLRFDRKRLTGTEMVLLTLTFGAAATLVGGPLLAGVLLMPLLFGVVVYRTRQLPDWDPSYGYVAAVCVPSVGFGAYAAGYDALAIDLVAFVVVPLVGALGLPVRLACRNRFGR